MNMTDSPNNTDSTSSSPADTASASKADKPSRRDDILQALAQMLQTAPGERITTAALAKMVGVSEAALYRHFDSKDSMFEALIDFIDETLFQRIGLILQEESGAEVQCQRILTLLLTFSQRNPGLTRLLTGEALTGETERLRNRISQFYDRLEAQLKQVLREAELRESRKAAIAPAELASLLLAVCEGKLLQFTRSGFKKEPLAGWDSQWQYLSRNLLQ